VSDPIDPRLDGRHRCRWATGTPLEAAYHDQVWGTPERHPAVLFEFLLLEGAQAGLSWRTILNKREGYRAAFAGFDPVSIAAFGDDDVARCLADPGIVRNRAKVRAFVTNARAWLALADPVERLWSFVGGTPLDGGRRDGGAIPATTAQSDAMSKALRAAGFTFVGSTICYAFMQATGMVNDHVAECFRYDELTRA
jgi:DNA-3-methyladenine glycosylase I